MTKITIITPSYRIDNLYKIKESINFEYVHEWIIVYDGSKIITNPYLFKEDNKIKEYIYKCTQSINLLLFLQKQNLATAIYLFGLGTLLTGLGLKHMRICSHHDLVGALVTSLFLGRPWWSTTSPTCLPLSVFTITSDQHRCRIPPLL